MQMLPQVCVDGASKSKLLQVGLPNTQETVQSKTTCRNQDPTEPRKAFYSKKSQNTNVFKYNQHQNLTHGAKRGCSLYIYLIKSMYLLVC